MTAADGLPIAILILDEIMGGGVIFILNTPASTSNTDPVSINIKAQPCSVGSGTTFTLCGLRIRTLFVNVGMQLQLQVDGLFQLPDATDLISFGKTEFTTSKRVLLPGLNTFPLALVATKLIPDSSLL
jgi:hypothetical protein